MIELPGTKVDSSYEEFNKFQTLFYTDIEGFSRYAFYDIRKHSVALLVNMAKGFPVRAQEILNIYSPEIKGINSPAIIQALQRKYVNNFSRPRVPQFIFYKSAKLKPASKAKTLAEKKGYIDFEYKIAIEIQSILFYDNKTYYNNRYSDKVQSLGRQLMGQLKQAEEVKAKKAAAKKK